jgi:single-stranded DNA-binding protein
MAGGCVEGRLRTREFEAKDKGQTRQRTEIIASRVLSVANR